MFFQPFLGIIVSTTTIYRFPITVDHFIENEDESSFCCLKVVMKYNVE